MGPRADAEDPLPLPDAVDPRQLVPVLLVLDLPFEAEQVLVRSLLDILQRPQPEGLRDLRHRGAVAVAGRQGQSDREMGMPVCSWP